MGVINSKLYISVRKNIISVMLAFTLITVNLSIISPQYNPETVTPSYLHGRRAGKLNSKAGADNKQTTLLLKQMPETNDDYLDSSKYHETFRRAEKTITNRLTLRTGGADIYSASISIQGWSSAYMVLFFSTLQNERDALIKYLHKKDGSK